MRILLVNVPHTAIGSRIPKDHLPPLGLLSTGGPLIDAGHDVRLLDADPDGMPRDRIVDEIVSCRPDAVLLGHGGSTSAHPTIADVTRAVRERLPDVHIVYGGVFPTYHWREILAAEPQIDVIVRGEGEDTTVRLIHALEVGSALETVRGIAFCRSGLPVATMDAELIEDLDAYRVGWELVDLDRYSYFGNLRAVVVQFARGCPHRCSYCGQRGFWTRWRHRDPRLFAAELARLHREHGVEVFNLADENPTSSRAVWLEFLEAMIAENVPIKLVGSTRADDIVRDADILHLYRKAGVVRFLLGTEHPDEKTLKRIGKDGSVATDRQAIRLLRLHGIQSLATWVVGFEDETDRDYLHGLRQLISYDPDQIQMIFATPHRWTRFFAESAGRRVIQTDPRLWDYKHQVLETKNVPPWRVMLWGKLIEAVLQLRPKAMIRLLLHPDSSFRAAQRWYYQVGRSVWPHEILGFLFRDKRIANGPALADFWGRPQVTEEFPHATTTQGPGQAVDRCRLAPAVSLPPDFGSPLPAICPAANAPV